MGEEDRREDEGQDEQMKEDNRRTGVGGEERIDEEGERLKVGGEEEKKQEDKDEQTQSQDECAEEEQRIDRETGKEGEGENGCSETGIHRTVQEEVSIETTTPITHTLVSSDSTAAPPVEESPTLHSNTVN